jgi:tetratricopeptide (TPR) repeat protein
VLGEEIVDALFDFGAKSRVPSEQTARYDRLVEHFDAAANAVLREHGAHDVRFMGAVQSLLRAQVAKTLLAIGVELGELKRFEQAIGAFDDLIARFTPTSAPDLCEYLAGALFNKGGALIHLGRPAEAIAAYDDLIARFTGASELMLRQRVAMALVNKGVALWQLGFAAEAIASYDEVVALFSDANDAILREQVVAALFNKGLTLSKPDRS